jgi:hypothetical protein
MKSELFALLALLTLFGGPLAGQECHDSGDIPDDAWAPTGITLDDARGFSSRRLLVMRAFWQSGPEALLIEDPGEVAAVFDLIAGNSRIGHACGYHWALVFENDSHRVLQHLHNKDCETYRHDDEEIQSRLRNYFQRIETRPSHFLINVAVDPAADPDTMMRLLERDGRNVFFLQSPDVRFPRLRITQSAVGPVPLDENEETARKTEEVIQAKARERIDAVIHLLMSQEQARVFEAPMQTMEWFGKGEYEYAMKAMVIFPLSFHESRLARYAKDLSLPADADDTLRAAEAAEPSFERPTSYTITVVSREPYSTKLGATIRALSPSIRDVSPPESVRLNE